MSRETRDAPTAHTSLTGLLTTSLHSVRGTAHEDQQLYHERRDCGLSCGLYPGLQMTMSERMPHLVGSRMKRIRITSSEAPATRRRREHAPQHRRPEGWMDGHASFINRKTTIPSSMPAGELARADYSKALLPIGLWSIPANKYGWKTDWFRASRVVPRCAS